MEEEKEKKVNEKRLDKKKNDKTKEEEKRSEEKRLKVLKSIMIGLDVFAVVIIILQIVSKSVSYPSIIVLILCNIITFMVKPSKK